MFMNNLKWLSEWMSHIINFIYKKSLTYCNFISDTDKTPKLGICKLNSPALIKVGLALISGRGKSLYFFETPSPVLGLTVDTRFFLWSGLNWPLAVSRA